MTVEAFDRKSVSVPYLLNQLADENRHVDGLVCVVRIDGAWQTCWTSGIDLGGLSMAAMKLLSDVTDEMHRPIHEPRDFGVCG